MMTIKHITLTGEEFVYPTTHINFVPDTAKPCAPATASVWRYDEDGRAYEIDSGSVYLMNEHGRTVARYSISSSEPSSSRRSVNVVEKAEIDGSSGFLITGSNGHREVAESFDETMKFS